MGAVVSSEDESGKHERDEDEHSEDEMSHSDDSESEGTHHAIDESSLMSHRQRQNVARGIPSRIIKSIGNGR